MGKTARLLMLDENGQPAWFHSEGNLDFAIRAKEQGGIRMDIPGRGSVLLTDYLEDPELPEGVDDAGLMADAGLVEIAASKDDAQFEVDKGKLTGGVIVKRDASVDHAKMAAVVELSNAFVAVVDAGIPYNDKAVRLDRDAAWYAAILVHPDPWKGLRVDCVDGSRCTVDDPAAFARAALETCARAEKLRARDADVRRAEDASAVAAVLKA